MKILEESRSVESIFNLVPAPAEDAVSRDYQDELYQIEAQSRALGSPVYDRSQSVAGAMPPPYLGEYLAKVLQPAAVTGLAALIGAWLQARHGRKARIKVGDIEVEANTVEEVEKLLEQARIIKRDAEPKKIYTP